jgi:hypothetical protein
MQLNIEIAFIFSVLMFLMGFYMTIVSPIIFNYFIIPKIEKKLGHKIGHHPLLDGIFIGKWMYGDIEIAMYICNRFFAYIIRGDRGLPKFCNRYALKKANYTIDMMSKIEIFMSIVLMLSGIALVICAVIALIAGKKIPTLNG